MTVDLNLPTYSHRLRDLLNTIEIEVAQMVDDKVAYERQKLEHDFLSVHQKFTQNHNLQASDEEISHCISLFKGDNSFLYKYLETNPILLKEYRVFESADSCLLDSLVSMCSESDLKILFQSCCSYGNSFLAEIVHREWTRRLCCEVSVLAAIKSGSVEIVESLLSCVVPPENSLEVAVLSGNCEIVQLLLDREDQKVCYENLLVLAGPESPVGILLYEHCLLTLSNVGSACYKNGDYEGAYLNYLEATCMLQNTAGGSQTNLQDLVRLEFNLSKALFRLNKFSESIKHCTLCIDLDPTYLNAYGQRAQCYFSLCEYDLALRDLSIQANTSLLEEIECIQNEDFYSILRVEPFSTDVKNAYKKLAIKFHPDKVMTESEDVQIRCKNEFTRIQNAYETLSNPDLRPDYDMNLRMRMCAQRVCHQNLRHSAPTFSFNLSDRGNLVFQKRYDVR